MTKYTLRLQIGPGLPSETVERELLNLVHNGLVDEVMLMIFLNEYYNGHETVEEINSWLASIRPWKKLLLAAIF